ncbi:MAG: hypothetical protein H0W30_16080 [Gemmatimonadaceae bacterium]|nr:hypothetical protein [Gemmatimonadaceae bacterium]
MPRHRAWLLTQDGTTTVVGTYTDPAGHPGGIVYFIDDPHAAEGIRNHLRNGNLPPEPETPIPALAPERAYP